ncbi:C1 family peptidase [Streptomyces parvus]|uniref:C1 family peptidase n=1 Tax=Streptomyces parvus TaxID=66428 RepID=UPI0033F67B31
MFTHRYAPEDPRLGRFVRHDPRSLDYAHPEVPEDVRTAVLWDRRIPIFDQGSLGSCTGNAFAGVLGTDSAGRVASGTVTVQADRYGIFAPGTHTLNEEFAVQAYSLNTRIDEFVGYYPPTDTGSSGLAAGKTGQALGLFVGYTHGFSIAALNTALLDGPVMWGTLWLQSMFDTDSDGFLVVDARSGNAGGHELIISGYDPAEDVYTIQNSWGTSWGDQGYARVHGADMAYLLAQYGDVVVPQYA